MTMFACLPWALIAAFVAVRSLLRRPHSIIATPSAWGRTITSLPTPILILLGLALFPAAFFTLAPQVSVYYSLPSVPAGALLFSVMLVSYCRDADVLFAPLCRSYAGLQLPHSLR